MEMKSTGIPRKSHDAHRPRGERYERGLLGWGPFRKALVQAKGRYLCTGELQKLAVAGAARLLGP